MADKIEIGERIYPQKPQVTKGAILAFYLFTIIFNAISAIYNIAEEDWLWVFLELLFVGLFIPCMLFLDFGKLTVHRKGFRLSHSLYNEYVKGKPKYIRIQDMIAIVPEYETGDQRLKIKNFKFYYNDTDYFELPHKDVKKYIDIIKTTFYNEWHILYNENYDIDNLDWKRVENILKLTERKVIGYSFALGFVIFGCMMVAMAKFIGTGVIFTRILNVSMMFLCSLQVGLAVGRMMMDKDRYLLLILKKFIKIKGVAAIPQYISSMPEFNKWVEGNEKYKILQVENFVDWQFQAQICSLTSNDSTKRDSSLIIRS
jgi:hypothetical protein